MFLRAFKSADSQVLAMGMGHPVLPDNGFISELRAN